MSTCTFRKSPLFRFIALMVLAAFVGLLPAQPTMAQVAFLPSVGSMVNMTSKFDPMVVKGIKLYPDNPFKFDFIVDTGDMDLSRQQIKNQGQELAEYFLASLTTPENEMWVNLSPYEHSRIIPKLFGETEMGKELLSQDYMLKQIMATALYPERQLGQEFWQTVYAQAKEQFGTTNVPVNTFNKVWIVPSEAVVYENASMNAVFVLKSRLKVMLEEDYLAANKHKAIEQFGMSEASLDKNNDAVASMSSKIIKQIVIPALEKEVNEGRNFAGLRQVYSSLILASWYKNNLRENVITKGYADRRKVLGIEATDKQISEKIYQQYLKAYRKGVYNYVKEEVDPDTNQVIPRKYFSGGFSAAGLSQMAMKVADPEDIAAGVREFNDSAMKGRTFLLATALIALSGFAAHAATQPQPVINGLTPAVTLQANDPVTNGVLHNIMQNSSLPDHLLVDIQGDVPTTIANALRSNSDNVVRVDPNKTVVRAIMAGHAIQQVGDHQLYIQIRPETAQALPTAPAGQAPIFVDVHPNHTYSLSPSLVTADQTDTRGHTIALRLSGPNPNDIERGRFEQLVGNGGHVTMDNFHNYQLAKSFPPDDVDGYNQAISRLKFYNFRNPSDPIALSFNGFVYNASTTITAAGGGPGGNPPVPGRIVSNSDRVRIISDFNKAAKPLLAIPNLPSNLATIMNAFTAAQNNPSVSTNDLDQMASNFYRLSVPYKKQAHIKLIGMDEIIESLRPTLRGLVSHNPPHQVYAPVRETPRQVVEKPVYIQKLNPVLVDQGFQLSSKGIIVPAKFLEELPGQLRRVVLPDTLENNQTLVSLADYYDLSSYRGTDSYSKMVYDFMLRSLGSYIAGHGGEMPQSLDFWWPTGPTSSDHGTVSFKGNIVTPVLLASNQAMKDAAEEVTDHGSLYGGIDLEKLMLQTRGSGVRTAFSDPRILRMLLNAKGLFPEIKSIEPVTVPMANMLLGFNGDQSANDNDPANVPVNDNNPNSSYQNSAFIDQREIVKA